MRFGASARRARCGRRSGVGALQRCTAARATRAPLRRGTRLHGDHPRRLGRALLVEGQHLNPRLDAARLRRATQPMSTHAATACPNARSADSARDRRARNSSTQRRGSVAGQRRTVAGDALSGEAAADCTIAVRIPAMRDSVSGSPLLQATSKVSFTLAFGVVTRACRTARRSGHAGSAAAGPAAGGGTAAAAHALGANARRGRAAGGARSRERAPRRCTQAGSSDGPWQLRLATRLVDSQSDAGDGGGDVRQQARPVRRHDGHLRGSGARQQLAVHGGCTHAVSRHLQEARPLAPVLRRRGRGGHRRAAAAARPR